MAIPVNYHYGISGLAVDLPRAQYPPEYLGRTRLEYYASLFNSIEVNSIFYQLPKPATIAKWAALVPPHFQFTFKLSKTITHVKDLAFNEEDIEAFMSVIQQVDDKKGCILIQFPPKLSIEHINELHQLLQSLHHHNEGWRYAVEFRNSSWYEKEVYELLEEVNATLVIQDIPRSATPVIEPWTDHIYLRFHGPEGTYRGTYAEEQIKRISTGIRSYLDAGKEVYCYFNNTAGTAVADLKRLNLSLVDLV